MEIKMKKLLKFKKRLSIGLWLLKNRKNIINNDCMDIRCDEHMFCGGTNKKMRKCFDEYSPLEFYKWVFLAITGINIK